jgi:hypothetical protein
MLNPKGLYVSPQALEDDGRSGRKLSVEFSKTQVAWTHWLPADVSIKRDARGPPG